MILERPLLGHQDNEDAAAHILATCLCYDTIPASVHRFLPLFTVGDNRNQWIDDLPTASRFDESGNCYYTSFPPGGFVVAYFTFKALGVEPDPTGLRMMNFGFSIIATLLLWLAVELTTRSVLIEPRYRYQAGFCAAAIMLTAPESLKSYTLSFWAHQIYLSILIVLAMQTALGKNGILFYACLFVGPFFEWTAFPAAIGVFSVCVIRYAISRKTKFLAHSILTLFVTGLAGLGLILWYHGRIGWSENLSALSYRSGKRSGGYEGLESLLYGYVVSLWSFLPLAGLLAIAAIIRNRLSANAVNRKVFFQDPFV